MEFRNMSLQDTSQYDLERMGYTTVDRCVFDTHEEGRCVTNIFNEMSAYIRATHPSFSENVEWRLCLTYKKARKLAERGAFTLPNDLTHPDETVISLAVVLALTDQSWMREIFFLALATPIPSMHACMLYVDPLTDALACTSVRAISAMLERITDCADKDREASSSLYDMLVIDTITLSGVALTYALKTGNTNIIQVMCSQCLFPIITQEIEPGLYSAVTQGFVFTTSTNIPTNTDTLVHLIRMMIEEINTVYVCEDMRYTRESIHIILYLNLLFHSFSTDADVGEALNIVGVPYLHDEEYTRISSLDKASLFTCKLAQDLIESTDEPPLSIIAQLNSVCACIESGEWCISSHQVKPEIASEIIMRQFLYDQHTIFPRDTKKAFSKSSTAKMVLSLIKDYDIDGETHDTLVTQMLVVSLNISLKLACAYYPERREPYTNGERVLRRFCDVNADFKQAQTPKSIAERQAVESGRLILNKLARDTHMTIAQLRECCVSLDNRKDVGEVVECAFPVTRRVMMDLFLYFFE